MTFSVGKTRHTEDEFKGIWQAQMKRKDGCGRIKLNRKRIESNLIGSQIRKTKKVNLVGLRKTKVPEICCYTNRRGKNGGSADPIN